MRSIFCVLLFMFVFLNAVNGQMLSAEHTWVTDNDYTLTISIMVDTDADLVSIEMTGPTENWFSYGFGDFRMDGTYAILVEENNGPQVTERILGNHNQGSLLASSIVNQEVSDVGDVRTVSLEFDLESTNNHFDFPITEEIINFISATGYRGTLAYHGSANHAESSQNALVGMAFSSLVPVTWSSFRVQEKDGSAFVSWKTESEVNNAGFYVQRSLDVLSWQDLDMIEGHGDEGGSYEYLDSDSPPGVVYYRIKQVDHDGTVDFSVVKSIEIDGRRLKDKIKFFPNPVQDILSLKMDSSDGVSRIKVMDMQMRKVIDEMWSERSVEHKTDVSQLPQGHYLLIVKNKKWSYSGHFIKL